MSALDIKLFRDLMRIWAQGLAIALVMACGVMTIVLAMGATRSLEETRAAFYERYRFADIFASVKRAPRHLGEEIARLEGVGSVTMRIVQPVVLDIAGMREPATGMAISLPDTGEPAANRLYIRKGRLPAPGATGETAVVETFAAAHGFEPGDRFTALMNGRKRELTITGIVLSPEYIYAIGPGDMVPDQRRFGVIYLSQRALAGIFDMEGAFNSLALTTLRNADEARIVEALDAMLEPYGGSGAHGRKDQISHAFLDSELTQLAAMARVIPPIFLFVAAFLVNMILSRLITLEREQIGLMKAVGYGDYAVAWHYAKLVISISLAGLLIGAVAGNRMGHGMTTLYAEFFSFPFLIFRESLDLYLIAGGVTVASALAGAFQSIRRIVSLPPAVAMRPPAPVQYGSRFANSWLLRPFSQLTIMAVRHLFRFPLRTGLTTLGTSFGVALLVTALFSFDSIDSMIDTVFFRADRQDATLSFSSEREGGAIHAVARMPGVLRAEPFRITEATFRAGVREKRAPLEGLPTGAELGRVLDPDLTPFDPPPSGIVLSERLAEHLDLRPGDTVEVDLRRFGGRTEKLTVTAIEQSYVGLTSRMRLDAMNRLLRDGDRISGARIAVDHSRLGDIYSLIKQTPAMGSIALQGVSRQRFRETIEENIGIMTTVYVTLAVVISFGVVYNSARIQLSERARELASLRVLGFTNGEVSGVLLTELGVVVLAAQPLGWVLGYAFSWGVTQGFQSDLFRVPLVVDVATFAIASLVVTAAAAISALVVRRRIDRLDLIRVLKTRD